MNITIKKGKTKILPIVITLLSAAIAIAVIIGLATWKYGSFSQAVFAARHGWIWLSPRKIDLGNHPLGSRLPFTITVVNDSTESARLHGMSVSCGCILAEPNGTKLPADIKPRTRLEIPFTMEVSDSAGNINQAIQFDLELGREQRQLWAEIHADVPR